MGEDNMCGQGAVDKSKTVQEFERLERAIEKVGKAIEILENKLAPVLIGALGQDGCKEETSDGTTTPLAETIKENRRRVNRIARMIYELNDRIDV